MIFPKNHFSGFLSLCDWAGPCDLLWPVEHQQTPSQQRLDKGLYLGALLLETPLRNFHVFGVIKMKNQVERKEIEIKIHTQRHRQKHRHRMLTSPT